MNEISTLDIHADERARMVQYQIAARGVEDERVLAAMEAVPREAFVAPEMAEFAYADSPLPIGQGQTISQPYVVALMAEAAAIEPDDRVLEVGTGSGYAAAVYGWLADQVYSIEWHETLAGKAKQALRDTGFDNVTVSAGDGSLGWPSEAPFDAILVAAGAPYLPEALKGQLAVGGRLVIPVSSDGHQQLLRVRRRDGNEFEEDDLGPVRFVPLVGKQGWHSKNDDAPDRIGNRIFPGNRERKTARSRLLTDAELSTALAEAAEPLSPAESVGFAAPFDRLGDAEVVGLGEATHGSAEFYRARAAITARLIQDHGFKVIAIEGDWPDVARIDRYVRDRNPAPWTEPAFTRFPIWMWRNAEMREFVEWLRLHNAKLAPEERVSVHGLDLYALHTSIAAVIAYLEEVDPGAAQVARDRYGCLVPWQKDPLAYGRIAGRHGMETCEKAVLSTLGDLLDGRVRYATEDPDDYLDAEGNAHLVSAAEKYYRTMYYGEASSWNLRDSHMFETLERVRQRRPAPAKTVIWAHNSHIGDAAATEMGVARGELNLGQLCRERYGTDAALLGFGTDRGQVAAASFWNGDMEVKRVQPAQTGSIEGLCRDTGIERFLLDLGAQSGSELVNTLRAPRLQRAIGVIYRPETELASHYFEISLPGQFDYYVWVAETGAVTPLSQERPAGVPETYPFGL